MSGRATLATFGTLLVLLALQFALAFTPVPRIVLPGIALVMVGLVGIAVMRLRAAGVLGVVFAMAGLFWMCVLLGLGSMDAATRTDIPVHREDVRLPSGGMPPR